MQKAHVPAMFLASLLLAGGCVSQVRPSTQAEVPPAPVDAGASPVAAAQPAPTPAEPVEVPDVQGALVELEPSKPNPGREKVQRAIDAWVWAHNKKPLAISLVEKDPARGPHRDCPVGLLCKADEPGRAYNYYAKGVWLMLAFGGLPAGTPSLPDLQKGFFVASVIITPPELAFKDWDIRAGGDLAFRAGEGSVSITGFTDGRVQGEIRGTIGEVGGYRENCAMADAPMPPHCQVGRKAAIPLVITFDLPLPRGTLDCRGPNGPAICGR